MAVFFLLTSKQEYFTQAFVN